MSVDRDCLNEITICSLNCQGLRDMKKRKDVMNYLRSYSILCLQDTHISKEMHNKVRNEWGFHAYFSSFTTQARGVAILINKKVDFKIQSCVTDVGGNFLFLDIEILNNRLTLGCVYAPNKDNPKFFTELKDNIFSIGNRNLLHQPRIDGWNYKKINNPLSRNAFLKMLEDLDLVDIWRIRNPDKLSYTWRRKVDNKIVQRGRLDSFLVSNTLTCFVNTCKILPGYRTDHSLINIGLSKVVRTKRKTFWKFNNSLLKYSTFLENIKTVIKEIKLKYISPHLTTEDSNDHNKYQSYLNPNLFLEVLLMEIRGECIRFASQLNKKDRIRENEIEEKLIQLHDNNVSISNEIETLENELKNIREKRMEGTLIRSRARWIQDGEKPTRYFCNLENRNFVSKEIHRLNVNGKIVEDEDQIIEEVRLFYKDLYSSRDEQLEDIELGLILNEQTPKLNEEAANSLDGPITLEEAGQVLKQFSHNKSPGTSGFTVEFLKVFWSHLGPVLIKSFNYSCEINQLPKSLTEGIITCIPKAGKDKTLLKNWRPISLLNVSYKIFSGIIAKRIRNILPQIISEDQTGFMSGRFIGDNIRVIYDILDYANIHEKKGILLLIDFEKAFDSISWKFLLKCLHYFNFSNDIIRKILLCFKDGKSTINVNSRISKWFDMERGCRQGDPLSPYLFLICAEILSVMLKQETKVKGYQVDGVEVLVSQYADDTSIFLDGSEESFSYCIHIILEYAKYSGLNMNFEKTKVVWFGCTTIPNTRYLRDINLEWNPPNFTILGVLFTHDLKDITDININKQLPVIDQLINNWTNRFLTPVGRITVVKSLIIPKIIHILTSLPDMSPEMLKHIEKMVFRFIWRNGPEKIKREIICQSKYNGGLGMLDIKAFSKSLKISWLRRLYNSNNNKWKNMIIETRKGIMNIAHYGADFMTKLISSCHNKFWCDVFLAYKSLCQKTDDFYFQHFDETPFMYNDNFKINKQTIFFLELEKHKVFTIKQLKNGDSFCTYDQFRSKYLGIKINYLHYHALITNVNKVKRHFETKKHPKLTSIKTAWDTIFQNERGVKSIYQKLSETNLVPTGVRKWQLNGEQMNYQEVIYSLYKTTSDTKLIWFQFRVIHNILTTNRSVSKYDPTHSEKCQFCNQQPEYITHLLFDCNITSKFWRDLCHKVNSRCNHANNLKFTKHQILFGFYEGNQRSDKVLNLTILLAKQFIYRCKFQDRIPQIKEFLKVLYERYLIEKSISNSKGENPNFLANKWTNYLTLFQGLDINF